MSIFQYLGFFLLGAVIIGAIAYLLGAPPLWIGIGAAIIMGIGVYTGRE